MSAILTSLLMLCLTASVISTEHQHVHRSQHDEVNRVQRTSNSVALERAEESGNFFKDIYDLIVKFFTTLSLPVSNFLKGIWNLIMFFPKFWWQVMKFSGSLFRTLMEMLLKGGYSWLKVQDVIIDFIKDFQKELLEALRANFFPNASPYRS